LSSVKVGHNRPAAKGNARLTAALILREVLTGRSLSDAAPDRLERLQDQRDRAFSQELCYGVMRWYPRLDWILQQLLKKPVKTKDWDVKALLLLGLYQLLYLRVAEHAALHETAGAANTLHKRWAVGLINGVLREFQRRREELLEGVKKDPYASSGLPCWLLERIQSQWPEQWRERAEAMSQRPPMSLRVNRKRSDREAYLQQLHQAGISAAPIAATQYGVILEKPQDVSGLPGFNEGLVSVQDGGAQLAAELLDIQPGQRILDACAAPGGKTGHILESAEDLQVTAVDVDETRLQRIQENLRRLQLDAEVVRGDAAQPQGEWAGRQYERILLDVPCSASGVIRRHPDIKYLRRAEDIPALAELQRRILKAMWPLLKPGGKLLYVTCSWLPEENAEQLTAFLHREASARELPLAVSWGEARAVGRQLAPGMLDMDGFYYALLQKATA
jgi:16S rRNA (cytosine967-C5)-methyltransferase